MKNAERKEEKFLCCLNADTLSATLIGIAKDFVMAVGAITILAIILYAIFETL